MDRVVLACSGSLTSSAAIRWLAEKQRAEVVTVTVDLGQRRELDAVRDRALAIGALRAHVIDGRDDFARAFFLPALQSGGLTPSRVGLSSAIARAAIAAELVRIAAIEGASAVAHGCVSDVDRQHLESCVRALDPHLKVLAPASPSTGNDRKLIDFARQRGIAPPLSVDGAPMAETTLLGRSVVLDAAYDTWSEPPEDLYVLTRSAADAPDAAAFVEITFDAGVPMAINGVEMSLVELLQSLQTIAGAHGVGRIDAVERTSGGATGHVVFESPALVVLHAAQKDLQTLALTATTTQLMAEVGSRYAAIIAAGQWFDPARAAMDALVASVQQRVSGTSRVKLLKAGCHVVGRKLVAADRESGQTNGAVGTR